MVAIRNGKIFEQVKTEDGYKIVVQEMASALGSYVAVKVFKGRKTVFREEMPLHIHERAKEIYRKYHGYKNPALEEEPHER